MINQKLSDNEKKQLLELARNSISQAVNGEPYDKLVLHDYSDALKEMGACFVTLTKKGELRGCIGTLDAYQPLVQDVCEHAIAAALEDYRFQPVRASELAQIKIEISRLTPTEPLDYDKPEDLPKKLRPEIDGVVLRDGARKATFLPQVWEKLPNAEEFLSHLCLKMGAQDDMWRRKMLDVSIYQVEEFSE